MTETLRQLVAPFGSAEVELAWVFSVGLALVQVLVAVLVHRAGDRSRRLGGQFQAAVVVPSLCLASALATVWLAAAFDQRFVDAERVRERALAAHRREIRARVEQATALVDGVRDSTLIPNGARKRHALQQLLQISFDAGDGYLFIVDEDRRLHSLGLERSAPGDVSFAYRSAIEEMISEHVRRRGAITLSYRWPSPSTGRLEAKLAHARAVPGWGWIIGAGAYLKGIEEGYQADLAVARRDIALRLASVLALALVLAAGAVTWGRYRARALTRALEAFGGRLEDAIRSRRPLDPETEAYDELRRMTSGINELLLQSWEQTELHRTLLEGLDAGVLVIDADDETIVDVNSSGALMLGAPAEALRGRRTSAVSPCRGCDAHACPAGARSWCEEPLVRLDGATLPVLRRLSRLDLGGRRLVLQTVVDTSELVAAKRELETSHRRLEEANVRLEAAAERARALQSDAEEASRAKSDFLATVSHELRTPIHGIAGMLDLIREEPGSTSTREHAGEARRSVDRLLAVVDAILEYSVGGAAARLEPPRALRLRELLHQILARSGVEERAEVEAIVRVDDHVSELIWAPARSLERVLEILVDNAVRFTPSGFVELGCAPRPDALELWVADSGIGIEAERQRTIFSPFTQADGAPNRRYEGAGLGLAIAQRCVEAMGGRIEVASAIGRGSRFSFRVRFPPRPRSEAPGTPDVGPTDGADGTRSPSESSGAVLVVDDNAINRKIATSMIRRLGYRVEAAQGGDEALQLLAERRFGLVFMDCQMPDLDGYEATRRLRAGQTGDANRQVPVVALTASDLEGSGARCFEAGMDGFMTKPIAKAELAETLRRWAGEPLDAPVTRDAPPPPAELPA